MRRILGAFCGVILVYGGFAFIALEMNPLSWPIEGRFCFVFFAMAFAAVGAEIIGD